MYGNVSVDMKSQAATATNTQMADDQQAALEAFLLRIWDTDPDSFDWINQKRMTTEQGILWFSDLTMNKMNLAVDKLIAEAAELVQKYGIREKRKERLREMLRERREMRVSSPERKGNSSKPRSRSRSPKPRLDSVLPTGKHSTMGFIWNGTVFRFCQWTHSDPNKPDAEKHVAVVTPAYVMAGSQMKILFKFEHNRQQMLIVRDMSSNCSGTCDLPHEAVPRIVDDEFLDQFSSLVTLS